MKTRMRFVTALLLLWPVLVLARLADLQILRHGEFVAKAARQQQTVFDQPANRGVIYDRNGQELAITVMVDSIFAIPNEIPDQAGLVALLAPVTGGDATEMLARFQQYKTFAWVARKVDPDIAERVRDLNLKGIYFMKEPKRFYPKRELAAQVLGYVGMGDHGLSGIEQSLDDDLSGNPGSMQVFHDARGQQLSHKEQKPEPGANIVLTIDEKIQYIAEKELDQVMRESGAVSGTVVVQNPSTGEILALANRPTYNPNNSREITPASLKNHAVSDVFEPGSMFKVCTVSSAIEEHLVTPESKINTAPGYVDVGGHRMHDDHGSLGTITVADVVAKSSNVGAIKIGLQLGSERFSRHINDYGFGRTTGIELPGETRGLVPPLRRWSQVTNASIAMGQGIGVTPIQIISMISTVANDGIYTPPRIVAGEANSGTQPSRVTFHPAQQHRVISAETAAKMKQMMEGVVLYGTARRAQLNGYTSAGKTGTAQKVDPRTGKYSTTAYIGSFAGFAPIAHPAISILVSLDSPKGAHQGGQISAPVFARIAQQVLAYLNVPTDIPVKGDPNRLLDNTKIPVEEEGSGDHQGIDLEWNNNDESAANAAREPGKAQGQPRQEPVPGLAKGVAEQRPEPQAPLSGMVEVSGGQPVPSFQGMTLRSAMVLAQKSGFELEVVGSGVAHEQYPSAGSHIASGSKVTVRFSR